MGLFGGGQQPGGPGLLHRGFRAAGRGLETMGGLLNAPRNFYGQQRDDMLGLLMPEEMKRRQMLEKMRQDWDATGGGRRRSRLDRMLEIGKTVAKFMG